MFTFTLVHKSQMKRLILIHFLFLPYCLFGQCDLLPISTTHEIIKHRYYTLSFNKKNEQAEWVAYLLTSSMLTGQVERGNNFRPDPDVLNGSAQLIDYKNSGYDKGHLCPAGDMTFSEEAMSETFYLSNMSPQVPTFNRGIWKSLETVVRSWAAEEDSIFIITGGIFSQPMGSIGPDSVTIPSQYYKVIYDLTGEKKMIGFVLPNDKGTKPLPDYAVSVSNIEKLTGIIFFPCLPDSMRINLEGNVDITKWDFENTGSSTKTQGPIHVKGKGKGKSADFRQCIGITKAGKQCSRKALDGSDYCEQHGKKSD